MAGCANQHPSRSHSDKGRTYPGEAQLELHVAVRPGLDCPVRLLTMGYDEAKFKETC